MSDIKDLTKLILEFRDKRDWKQFHNPKDVALSLVLEAAEVLEHFQWKNKEEVEHHLQTNRKAVGEELADVLYWTFLLGHDVGVDLREAFVKKMRKNAKKYPVRKARGTHKKYTEL